MHLHPHAPLTHTLASPSDVGGQLLGVAGVNPPPPAPPSLYEAWAWLPGGPGAPPGGPGTPPGGPDAPPGGPGAPPQAWEKGMLGKFCVWTATA